MKTWLVAIDPDRLFSWKISSLPIGTNEDLIQQHLDEATATSRWSYL
jgi:hypothetical protein